MSGAGRYRTVGDRIWATVAATAAAFALTTTAYGGIGVGETAGVDTPYTPIAKDPPEGMFKLEAGTRYEKPEANERNLISNSPTSFGSDLYAVSFRDSKRGFAGGAETSSGTPEPVLYSYELSEGWRRVDGFPSKGQGYIAAIDWIDDDRALAVGGDGEYPEQERAGHSCTEGGDPRRDETEGAGMARAWLYERESGWRELQRGSQLPDSMRALTALDFYVPAPSKQVEFGVAGGMCQLWHWSDRGFMRAPDETFLPPFSAEHPTDHPQHVAELVHRVRSVAFSQVASFDPPIDAEERRPVAFAALAGCCAAGESALGERAVLRYGDADPAEPAKSGRWDVEMVDGEPTDAKPTVAFPDSFVSVTATRSWDKTTWTPGYVTSRPPAVESKSPGLIATALGEPARSELEPSSTVGHGPMVTAGPHIDRETPRQGIRAPKGTWLADVRLLDGDGDLGGGEPVRTTTRVGSTYHQGQVALEPELLRWGVDSSFLGSGTSEVGVGGEAAWIPDGVPDWSVGEQGESRQAIVYATDPGQLPPPRSAVARPPTFDICNLIADDGGQCQASVTAEYPGRVLAQHDDPADDSKRIRPATQSHKLLKLPVYGLHSIDFIDDERVGWAVGRNGGIVKFGSISNTKRSTDRSPELGKADKAPTPPDHLWATTSEPPGRTGLTPSLGDMPPQREAVRALHTVSDRIRGADKVRDIVVSRAGGEGWAFTPDGPIHYDGAAWNPCYSPSPAAIDSACAGLAELGLDKTIVRSAVRVPNERDDDPGNDDDFEVAGLGGPSGLVRYRDGRWIDEGQTALAKTGAVPSAATALAFVSPTDGWLSLPDVTALGSSRLWRFDGKQWRDCAIPRCDPHQRLAKKIHNSSGSFVDIKALRTAGGRLYAIGDRAEVVSLVRVSTAPFVAYRDQGETEWSETPRQGEYDPLFDGTTGSPLGREQFLRDAAIVQHPDGRYEGWGVGDIGGTPLLRLGLDGNWKPYVDEGITGEQFKIEPNVPTMISRQNGSFEAYSAGRGDGPGHGARSPLRYDTARDRWAAFGIGHSVSSLASDNRGGLWVVKAGASFGRFHHYTDMPPRPVFREVPQPSRLSAQLPITSIAGAADGTLWATTASQIAYRYNRILGWSSVRIPGWEPGRTVSAPSPAYATAIDTGGRGYIVGARGRIARIDRDGVQLDPAAGRPCPVEVKPPCGTASDLKAVSVSDDGAALAAGEQGALVWKPPGHEGFRSIVPPAVEVGTAFISVALLEGGRSWLVTDGGEVFAGAIREGGFRWRLEHKNSRLRAIAIRPDGSGFMVGRDGLILQRSTVEAEWTRVPSPTSADLSSITVARDGEAGALIGGADATILTFTGDRFRVARPGDPHHQGLFGEIPAIALLPGRTDGQVEAWAMVRTTGSGQGGVRLLHHSSDPEDPLLAGGFRGEPLPDAPPARTGELEFAAFGKSDCHITLNMIGRCLPIWGTTDFADTVSAGIVDQIAARARRGNGPIAALFSGDGVDSTGWQGGAVAEEASPRNSFLPLEDLGGFATGSSRGAQKMRRWGELVADRLTDLGVPLFAAIGGRDLAETRVCYDTLVCHSTDQREEFAGYGKAGENLDWRQAMVRRSSPWGKAPATPNHRYRFRKVRSPLGEVETNNVDVGKRGDETPSARVPTGGAPTHYALDVTDTVEARKVARLVFADTSQGSLSGSEALQQPRELSGAQAAWLDQMLCIRGSAASAGCSRASDQQAVVITNAPTYTYGPGAANTATDGAAIEAILLKNRANLAVTGRIGWNGLYWTKAPGIHEPCPGGDHPQGPPDESISICGAQPPVESKDVGREAAGTLGSALAGDVAADGAGSGAGSDVAGAPIPFLIASGAGGRFAAEGEGTAGDGYWHGYSIVRLDRSGDTRKTIVEQRPIYDWVGIEAAERVLRAGQRMTLRGFARAPIGTRISQGNSQNEVLLTRYDRIDGPGVTHRYDLLEADPRRPWLAQRDETGAPVPLDPAIATVDRQTGNLKVGRGNNPRTFAVAFLSVGDHAATYPLVFEPRRTFAPTAPAPSPRSPTVTVQSAQAPTTAPPSAGTPAQIGSVSPPVLPTVPSVPQPPAVPPTSQPQPAPPPPPAPPPAAPTALELAPAPPGLTVAPPASVIPPPAPPINPAPPGGARKEARQRQAATEKSGSDSGAGQSEMHEAGGDPVSGPPGSSGSPMTRRDREKAEPSFTTVSRTDQPSAWARGALYGGGLMLAALAMSGFWTARPRPRPNPPAVPAPARSRAWSRRW